MTLSNFFWRPFWKSYSLTIKAKFYHVNPSNLTKTEKTHGRDKSGSNSPPFEGNWCPNSPIPGHNAQSNARGMPGGGCWITAVNSTRVYKLRKKGYLHPKFSREISFANFDKPCKHRIITTPFKTRTDRAEHQNPTDICCFILPAIINTPITSKPWKRETDKVIAPFIPHELDLLFWPSWAELRKNRYDNFFGRFPVLEISYFTDSPRF